MTYRNSTWYYSVLFLHLLLIFFITCSFIWFSPRIIYISIVMTLVVTILYKVNRGCIITHHEQKLSNNESYPHSVVIKQIFCKFDTNIKEYGFKQDEYIYDYSSYYFFFTFMFLSIISLYFSCRYLKKQHQISSGGR